MEGRILQLEKRVDKLEEQQATTDLKVHQLDAEQRETKIYVKQIFEKISELKTGIVTKEDLFALVQQQTKEQQKTYEKLNKQNAREAKGWRDHTIEIIKLTVAVLIGYIFMR